MRYKSGLEKKDLKKYLLKLSFTYCSIILISIFVIICIINPSMFISELIVILSISLLLFIIISLGSYISLLFFPFGVNRYYLQNNAIDYCINVHDDKIIISYNFLSNEGIKPILNTIYKKDINSIVSDINFRDEFSFIDRIKILLGYKYVSLPPGVLFTPLINKKKIVKIFLIKEYEIFNYSVDYWINKKTPDRFTVNYIYIELKTNELNKFISDVSNNH